jgi:hypothetical protein
MVATTVAMAARRATAMTAAAAEGNTSGGAWGEDGIAGAAEELVEHGLLLKVAAAEGHDPPRCCGLCVDQVADPAALLG